MIIFEEIIHEKNHHKYKLPPPKLLQLYMEVSNARAYASLLCKCIRKIGMRGMQQ